VTVTGNWERDGEEEEEEEEEEVRVLALTSERKRGNEPVSPSPPPAFSGRARCGAQGAGRLYVGKMRWGGCDAVGVGGAGADEEAAGGEGRGSRCVVP
jgi:hypothetical protein